MFVLTGALVRTGVLESVAGIVLERAHDYLDTLGEAGAPVVFEELAREVFPEQPERLDALLDNCREDA